MMLAYLMVPDMQKELDTFVTMWSSHRIREQHNTLLPVDVLNHIYNFPEQYGIEEGGELI